ncbi:MAG TPA: DUF3892 domain-containing protein [Roseiarcus sp.]|nr:DUF3892 domain-containing protein [Roseiarcus sp.]
MAKLVQIQCVKCDEARTQPCVRFVGGINPDGTRWRLSEENAIAGMKEGKWRFWTAGERKSVWIVTAKSASGREYLKAEPDWVQPATLLTLPECP